MTRGRFVPTAALGVVRIRARSQPRAEYGSASSRWLFAGVGRRRPSSINHRRTASLSSSLAFLACVRLLERGNWLLFLVRSVLYLWFVCSLDSTGPPSRESKMPAVVNLKWGRERLRVDVPDGAILHDVVATRFNIPRQRLRLTCKGKLFGAALPRTETDQLIEMSSDGHTITVLGTPAQQQLPAFKLAFERLKSRLRMITAASWLWRGAGEDSEDPDSVNTADVSPRAPSSCCQDTITFCQYLPSAMVLFVTSAFYTAPAE